MRPPKRPTRGQPRLPAVYASRLGDAGASAYRWYEEGVEDFLDPHRVWARRSRGTVLAMWVAAAAVILVATPGPSKWPAVAAAVAVLGGAIVGAGAPPRPLAALALLSVAATLSTPTGVAAVAVVVLLAVSVTARAAGRGIAAAAVTCALGAAVWAPAAALGIAAAAVATLVLSARVGALHPTPWARRLTRDAAFTGGLPMPTSGLPWITLARHQRRVRRGDTDYDRVVPGGHIIHVNRRVAGVYGETRTALWLLGLPRGRGTRILHDVSLPGAETANIDHVVLTRGGVFVLDSKTFGSRSNPGQVLADRGTIIERTGAHPGGRDIAADLKTVLWATRTVSDLLGVPARGLVVAHHARVTGTIGAIAHDGVTVEVIQADELLERIVGGVEPIGRRDYRTVRFEARKLRSAATGRGPRAISPVGLAGTSLSRRPWNGVLDGPGMVRIDQAHLDATTTQAASGPWKPGDTQPLPVVDVASLPSHQPPPEPIPEPAAPPAPDPAPAGLSPASTRVIESVIEDRWVAMLVSRDAVPAPMDDVPSTLRGVTVGTPVAKVTPSMDGVTTAPLVAMSAPLVGVAGKVYMWVTSPGEFARYTATGKHVMVATEDVSMLIRQAPR